MGRVENKLEGSSEDLNGGGIVFGRNTIDSQIKIYTEQRIHGFLIRLVDSRRTLEATCKYCGS